VVEDTQRITIAQVRALPGWPQIREGMAATIVLDSADGPVVQLVTLATDRNNFGVRYWLGCPRCNSRRRHLFLAEQKLVCRRCARLLYYVQRLPDSSFRRDMAVPLLRQRIQDDTAVLPSSGW